MIWFDDLISRLWSPIRSYYPSNRAGGIDVNKRSSVINWVIVYFQIVTLWQNDRVQDREGTKTGWIDENRFIFSFIFHCIFTFYFLLPFLFFKNIRKVYHVLWIWINRYWSVVRNAFSLLLQKTAHNFASFKCRVIKNNSNGKFNNTIDVHIETYSTVEIVIPWLILCLF